MRIVIVCQARMRSSRLPGKVLMEVLGRPLLEYEVQRLRRATHPDGLVVATTNQPIDEAIVTACARLGAECWRGDEIDVLGRFWGAAMAARADVIVRVTADCPLIDPGILDQAIAHFTRDPHSLDYVVADSDHGFPRGLDCEVFSVEALTMAHEEARDPYEREHVTPFLYRHPERFRLDHITAARNRSHHRWTVDTAEDLALVTRILVALYPSNPAFSWLDVLDLVEKNPYW